MKTGLILGGILILVTYFAMNLMAEAALKAGGI